MSQQHRIDYFELFASDLGAAKDFYSAAFGWKFTDYGPRYAGFVCPDAEREAGGVTSDKDRAGASLAILYSEDPEACGRNIQAAGGKIVKPIFSFPGGRRFHFTGPSGNELAVWSDKQVRSHGQRVAEIRTGQISARRSYSGTMFVRDFHLAPPSSQDTCGAQPRPA